MLELCSLKLCLPEILGRSEAQYYKYNQRDELRNLERRLSIRRRKRVQRRHLLKELRDQHKEVQPFRNHGRDHKRRSPSTRHFLCIQRKERHRQHHQRNDPENDSRRNPLERKEKSRDAGQNRRPQKDRRPESQPPPRDQPKNHNEPGPNPDQTQQHMKRRVRSQHSLPLGVLRLGAAFSPETTTTNSFAKARNASPR